MTNIRYVIKVYDNWTFAVTEYGLYDYKDIELLIEDATAYYNEFVKEDEND